MSDEKMETAQQDTDLQARFDALSAEMTLIASGFEEVKARFAEAGLEMLIVPDDGAATMNNLVTAYKQMESERDTAVSSLAEITSKAEAAALKDLGKAKATPKPRGENGRALGPLKPKKDEPPLSGGNLLAAIAAADVVEVAFSDGKREIKLLPAHVIQGDAWYLAANGVRLRVDKLQVFGPNRGEPDLKLAGYALLLDGEQVAYQTRSDVLVLTAGSTNELKDDVIF